MKITVLGPVWPYKGGIAQYTGALCTALRKKHEVTALSYSMQYPKLLYKHPQRDTANTAFRFEPVAFLLNTVNPLSWRRTAKQIREQEPDLLVIQWWHPWFAPCYASLLRQVRSGRCRTLFVMICHNVLPHEGFPMKEKLTRRVLRLADAFIVHSGQDAEDLKRFVKNPLFIHACMPAFDQFQRPDLTRTEARRELAVPDGQEMLLFFGYIREYKGLKHLIRALPAIRKARPQVHLYVVGDFFENNKLEYEQLIRETDAEDGLTLVDGYLPDDRVGLYFTAADLCVLPYESATQSAVVQVAYSFGLPVIATRVGGLPEAVQEDRTGWIVPPRDPDALADAVIRFFEQDKGEFFRNGIREEAEWYSWDRMTEHLETLADKLREAEE